MYEDASHSGPLEGERFSALYRAESRRVLIFFARRVFDPEVALDLTAETFAQAIAGRRGFKGEDDDDAVAWVFGIASHQLSRYYRSGRAEKRALGKLAVEVPRLHEEEVHEIEREADLVTLREAMREALAAVSDEQRAALELRLVQELAYDEVARRLGISEDSARARVSRGLRALGSYFESHPLPEEAT